MIYSKPISPSILSTFYFSSTSIYSLSLSLSLLYLNFLNGVFFFQLFAAHITYHRAIEGSILNTTIQKFCFLVGSGGGQRLKNERNQEPSMMQDTTPPSRNMIRFCPSIVKKHCLFFHCIQQAFYKEKQESLPLVLLLTTPLKILAFLRLKKVLVTNSSLISSPERVPVKVMANRMLFAEL
jgi:hypothetical protein